MYYKKEWLNIPERKELIELLEQQIIENQEDLSLSCIERDEPNRALYNLCSMWLEEDSLKK